MTEEENMYKYFVSFWFVTKSGPDGFGSTEMEANKPVISQEEIHKMTDILEKQLEDVESVIILNWRRFEEE